MEVNLSMTYAIFDRQCVEELNERQGNIQNVLHVYRWSIMLNYQGLSIEDGSYWPG